MRFLLASAAFGLFCAFVALADPASACGGTFCDAPPPGLPPMPVDQSGENILFVMEDGHVEAHIQIQYTGDPASFAWLVPVPAVPDLSVGSDDLFLNLLNGTVPTFTVTNRFDSCSGGSTTSRSGGGCGFGMSDSSSGSFDGTGGADDTGAMGAEVADKHEAVGAFDATVLQPTSAAELDTWLVDNGFLNTADAPTILQDYIDSGHVFVAVKLRPGAGVNEIHPLVIRYAGTEPCIPLKLTRIAATADMRVRAFFLGDRRVVPTSYREVTLNPAQLDWVGLGDNYTSVVSRAVDQRGADGHAFVTEYAGPSDVVSGTGIASPAWDSAAFRGATPETAMMLLGQQGLLSCFSGSACTTSQPLLLPIVRKYIPAPVGMSEQDFYGCISCHSADVDLAAWNADAFATEMEERIFAPARHAEEILRVHPYVTRLFTTISPDEMTEDPMFAPASLSLGPVSEQLAATVHRYCGGDTALEVAGQRDVALDSGVMPTFGGMPYAATVIQYDTAGMGTRVRDELAAIDTAIAAWNAEQGYPGPRTSTRTASFDDGSRACACVLGGGGGSAPRVVGLVLAFSLLRRLRRPRRMYRRSGPALSSAS